MIFREVASNPDTLNFLWSNIFVSFFVVVFFFYGGRERVGNGIQRGKKRLKYKYRYESQENDLSLNGKTTFI